MPQHSANKAPTKKTAVVSEAMPQQALKSIQEESANALKGWVATSQTAGPTFACHKHTALVVITFINSVASTLTLIIFIQSGKIGGSEEFEFSDEDYEDDDSHDTPPQVDEVANPLFNLTFSLPTWVTGDSHTSDG
jgi:hypothetical protein